MAENLLREPTPSELKFFQENPGTGGMATGDDRVILNPFSSPEVNKQAVLLNEASRIFLRQNKIVPKFKITDKQRAFFSQLKAQGTPAEQSDEDIRATIVGRVISGDPSAQDITTEQILFANKIKRLMGIK